MKIKAPFRIEVTKKPLVLAKGGAYRPEKHIHHIITLQGEEAQTCVHEIKE